MDYGENKSGFNRNVTEAQQEWERKARKRAGEAEEEAKRNAENDARNPYQGANKYSFGGDDEEPAPEEPYAPSSRGGERTASSTYGEPISGFHTGSNDHFGTDDPIASYMEHVSHHVSFADGTAIIMPSEIKSTMAPLANTGISAAKVYGKYIVRNMEKTDEGQGIRYLRMTAKTAATVPGVGYSGAKGAVYLGAKMLIRSKGSTLEVKREIAKLSRSLGRQGIRLGGSTAEQLAQIRILLSRSDVNDATKDSLRQLAGLKAREHVLTKKLSLRYVKKGLKSAYRGAKRFISKTDAGKGLSYALTPVEVGCKAVAMTYRTIKTAKRAPMYIKKTGMRARLVAGNAKKAAELAAQGASAAGRIAKKGAEATVRTTAKTISAARDTAAKVGGRGFRGMIGRARRRFLSIRRARFRSPAMRPGNIVKRLLRRIAKIPRLLLSVAMGSPVISIILVVIIVVVVIISMVPSWVLSFLNMFNFNSHVNSLPADRYEAVLGTLQKCYEEDMDVIEEHASQYDHTTLKFEQVKNQAVYSQKLQTGFNETTNCAEIFAMALVHFDQNLANVSDSKLTNYISQLYHGSHEIDISVEEGDLIQAAENEFESDVYEKNATITYHTMYLEDLFGCQLCSETPVIMDGGEGFFGTGPLGEVHYYCQGDYPNTKFYYGGRGDTVKSGGCGITSFAMLASIYGKTITPADIAALHNKTGGNTYNTFGSHGAIANLARHYGIPAPEQMGGGLKNDCSRKAYDYEYVKNKLESGCPIIVSQSGGYWNESGGGHYTLLYGVGKNGVRVYDPGNRGKYKKCMSDDGYSIKGVMAYAKHLWIFPAASVPGGNGTGKEVPAEFTAYYPANNRMEGGFYDCMGKRLNPDDRTCAAPKSVKYGSYIYIKEMKDLPSFVGRVYRVNDRGGGIFIKTDGTYRIDILMHSDPECDQFGRRHGKILINYKVGK